MKKLILGLAGSALAGLLVLVILLTGGGDKPKHVFGEATNVDQIGAGEAVMSFERLSLGSGVQFVSQLNQSGAAVIIKDTVVQTTDTASSTMYVAMGTSSAATLSGGAGLSVWNDGGITATNTFPNVQGDAPFTGIIGFFQLATSTNATTTSMSSVFNQTETDAGPNGMIVQPGEYLWLLLVTGDQDSKGPGAWCDPTGGDRADSASQTPNVCEYATSTARGFNVEAYVEWIATSTINNFDL